MLGIRQSTVLVEAPSGVTDRVHVHFTPAGLSRFTAVPAQRLAGRIVSADELFPPGMLDRLTADLWNAKTLEKRAFVLDAFFERLLRPLGPREEMAVRLATRILETPEVSLAELLHGAPARIRQVERLFQRLVGVSPRVLVRVARFDRARNAVLSRDGESLSGIALDAGYYDQAHFNREFRRHASMPPGSYSFCAPSSSQRSFPARSHAT